MRSVIVVPLHSVTNPAPGELTHRWPQVLPGGKAVLFTASTSEARKYSARLLSQ
jgi:hypothetical protein